MAANTLVHASPGWTQNEIVTSAQLNQLDYNIANSVNRISTKSGWRDCGLVLAGMETALGAASSPVIPANGRVLLANGDNDLSMFSLLGLPIGHTLKYVRLHFTPQSGHAAQPSALPSFRTHGVNGTGEDGIDVLTKYTWVSTSTYEAGFWLQTIDLSAYAPTSAIVTADRHYAVTVHHERLTNSKPICLDSIQAYCEVNTAQGGPDFTHWA